MSADFVILGLGSNLNCPLNNLRLALSELKKIKNIEIKKVSSIYESEAQVPELAPLDWNKEFLNAAVLIHVLDKPPGELLIELKKIEQLLGRKSSEIWAPRCIDIDILYWHQRRIDELGLIIPHPRLLERPFALLPLLQVFPEADLTKPIWANDWVAKKPFHTIKSKKHFWPELVGIINLTTDSFSDAGKWSDEQKINEQLELLINSGASVLDLGAESTRPGAIAVNETVEFEKLKIALDIIKSKKLNSIKISIDSYKANVIEKCLENFEIDFVNDVTGLRDEKIISLVKQSGKKVFVMHSLSVPAVANEIISEPLGPIIFLKEWWSLKRNELLLKGLSDQQLVFDPGIGFGKSAEQNLYILRNLEQFDSIKNSILIGHSRKSYQTIFSDRKSNERDLETALITLNLNLAYTQYLRIHDVKSQVIALRAQL
ncbi:MAG: dihydropteroate synthase [Pseudobdellovibrio sp.]